MQISSLILLSRGGYAWGAVHANYQENGWSRKREEENCPSRGFWDGSALYPTIPQLAEPTEILIFHRDRRISLSLVHHVPPTLAVACSTFIPL